MPDGTSENGDPQQPPPAKSRPMDRLEKHMARGRGDLLTGSLRTTVFLLALPVLCEQFLTFCVGFVDTFLSGRIGPEATEAVGFGAYVGWLASMFFGLVGTGTTALVARYWGAGDFPQANRIMNRSMALAAVMGLIFYAIIFTAAPGLAHLLRMHGTAGRIVVRYLRLDGLGHLFTCLSLVGAAALRGSGDMRTPMFILGVVNVINMVVSTLLVYGFGPYAVADGFVVHVAPVGIDGIVIGTVTARFIGGMLMLGVLGAGLSGLHLVRREWRVRGQTVRRILRIGLPAALDGAVMWTGQLLFLMVIGNLPGSGPHSPGASSGSGSEIFAAHFIGVRVEAITYLPAVAWGYAAATIVGQSLGAGNRDRAVRAGHEAVRQCSLLAIGITLAFYFGAGAIYRVMHQDAAVREIGVPAFQMLAFFQVPLVVSIVYVFSLRGAGDTRYPLLITLVGVIAVRLPLAYLCGIVLSGGLIGAWIGMCADMALRAVLVGVRYLRGRWVGTVV